jgi:hypothetical protein
MKFSRLRIVPISVCFIDTIDSWYTFHIETSWFLYSFINKMVFSLEHIIKVIKSHQNLLPTQSVIVVHTDM